MTETVVLLGTARDRVGIVTEPERTGRTGALLLNAGLLHRVGPNRLYVRLARTLAEAGLPTLRFDFSGFGDSAARNDTLPFEQFAVEETVMAMDYLQSTYGVDRFLLAGICSGADIALRTGREDPRVAAAVLINGMRLAHGGSLELFHSAGARASLRQYGQRLLQPRSWVRALTGRSDFRAIWDAVSRLSRSALTRRSAPAKQSGSGDLSALTRRGARILLLYSEGDASWDLYRMNLEKDIREFLANGSIQVTTVPGADHVFTLIHWQQALLEAVREWVRPQEWTRGG